MMEIKELALRIAKLKKEKIEAQRLFWMIEGAIEEDKKHFAKLLKKEKENDNGNDKEK